MKDKLSKPRPYNWMIDWLKAWEETTRPYSDDLPTPHTKAVPRSKVVVCPPGEAEPPDPGWEAHKPRERPGFRELDEYNERFAYLAWKRRKVHDEDYETRVVEVDRWEWSDGGEDSDNGDSPETPETN